jgi:hypothetical protein
MRTRPAERHRKSSGRPNVRQRYLAAGVAERESRTFSPPTAGAKGVSLAERDRPRIHMGLPLGGMAARNLALDHRTATRLFVVTAGGFDEPLRDILRGSGALDGERDTVVHETLPRLVAEKGRSPI